MIKLFEEYEYTDHELVDKLIKKIISDNKKINDFECSMDMSGSIEWYNKNYNFYATPYWEYENFLPVEIFIDYEESETYEFRLKPLTNLKVFNEMLNKYYGIVYNITEKLNKRRSISKILNKIYDDLSNDIQDKLSIIDDSKEPFANVSTDELIEIYNEIKEKYPEIISANYYNL